MARRRIPVYATALAVERESGGPLSEFPTSSPSTIGVANMAKVSTAKRTRTKRPKQPFLHQSMEPPHHADIDAAAENYYEVMMDRCKLSKEEDEKKDALIDKM